jgi:hypothetical protein
MREKVEETAEATEESLIRRGKEVVGTRVGGVSMPEAAHSAEMMRCILDNTFSLVEGFCERILIFSSAVVGIMSCLV